MNFLKYVLGKKTIPFETPDDWGDVPFKTYVEYNKLIRDGKADKPSLIYSLFMPKVSVDEWEKPQSSELYQSIQSQLNFISTEPSKEVPTHVVHDDYDVLVPKSVGNVDLNQYWGMLKAVDDVVKGKGDDVDTLEIMPDMIAIMLFKEYNEDNRSRLCEEIKSLPTPQVYGLGCFFLQKFHDLNHGTTLICRAKRIMKRILMLGMAELVIITVILSHLITFQKGSLASVKSYLKRKLLKCTWSYKYLLIFPSVKKSIVK